MNVDKARKMDVCRFVNDVPVLFFSMKRWRITIWRQPVQRFSTDVSKMAIDLYVFTFSLLVAFSPRQPANNSFT
jgi:hypothetical protein